MLRAYARAAADGPHGAGLDVEDSAAIAALLLDLRGEEREVLLLHAWADLDYDQIASALGIPVGTVRSRLSRARERLRTRLTTPAPTEEALDG
jgi:RNA polymerase sigma-70 factor (ECF subfamily)